LGKERRFHQPEKLGFAGCFYHLMHICNAQLLNSEECALSGKKDEKVFVLFLVAICLVLGVLRQSTDWLAGKFVSKMTLMCGVGHFNSTETGFPHM